MNLLYHKDLITSMDASVRLRFYFIAICTDISKAFISSSHHLSGEKNIRLMFLFDHEVSIFLSQR